MTIDTVSDLVRNSLYVIIVTSAPLLLVSLVVGLTVSIFQTVTSIQEQTLTFVPKVIAIFLGIMVMGHWMMNNMVSFTQDLWSDFSLYIK
ncbi:MAG: flagellar biosynthesis protein FliQ [Lachnospiraceae bacterium]|nr:flagellar biosynthesis protein FliQ [Lachnospiraceae bacterium]